MDTPAYPTHIPLERALQSVAAQAARLRLPVETIRPADARGCVLAEDIHAPCAAGAPVSRDLALESGTLLGTAELAVLAASGTAQIGVRRPPRIAVIAMDGERAPAGQSLESGQIHESTAVMLRALAGAAGLRVVAQACVHDDPAALRAALLDAAADADIVITGGPASKGEADHLPRVLAEMGEIHFHKVRLQPGRATLFAQIGACLCFGLPGEPEATAVAFRVFVGFAVRALLGATRVPEPVRARLAEALHKQHADTELVRCTLHADADGVPWVTPHPRQGPGLPRDAAATDVLALLPEGEQDYRRGQAVTLWPA